MPEFDRQSMGRVRKIHFVGVGGAGMSGIAEVLHNLGYQVSGSDLQSGKVTQHLEGLGISIQNEHRAENINGSDVVVVSSAVNEENPEIREARKQRIPVIRRAEMLAELMRFRQGIAIAGTHGKTTTTSLVASVLAEAGLDPTYVIGGLLNSSGSNAKLGTGQYLVAEADESDASFLHLQPVMAVLTNIDSDHLDAYAGDYRNLQSNFLEFLHRLPFYGLAILCIDDSGVQAVLPELTRSFITYGQAEGADYRAENIRFEGSKSYFSVTRKGETGWLEIELNLPGTHNVMNALAAIALASELDLDSNAIRKALAGFAGIDRRCNIMGEIRIAGCRVLLIDDYAHHPREIAAIISAIRLGWPGRRITAVFQPHRYTRTRDLFDDFCQELSEIDVLILLDVYPASEKSIIGADSRTLGRGIRMRGKIDPVYLEDDSSLNSIIQANIEDGDVLLMMGAGDIGSLSRNLYEKHSRQVQ